MLISCLDDYILHLKENPESLLGRYYGLFKVKTPFFRPVYIVLMGNVNQLQEPEKLIYNFDLKGSTISRSSKNFNTKKAL